MNGKIPNQYKILDESLELVKKALMGEKEDDLFYDYMLSIAPTKEEKEIINTISNNKKKQYKMFKEIYKFFTGKEVTIDNNFKFINPKSYKNGVKKALFEELSAVEKYRIIRAGMPKRYFQDMVFEILTDALEHAQKYNYILNINVLDKETINKDYNNMLDKLLRDLTPLIKYGLDDIRKGTINKSILEEYILMGALVGKGINIEEAYTLVKKRNEIKKTRLKIKSKIIKR
jgi:rubrerythrin